MNCSHPSRLTVGPSSLLAAVTWPKREFKRGGHPIPRHMVTFNDVQNGKPDPEPYLLGARILGFSAADCIAIEDAPAGIVSGKAAGARVIALRTTATDEELRSASPDWILDDCSSISATFEPATGVLRLDLALPD